MSITDELRTGGIYSFPSNTRRYTLEELTAIADRIDAEHEAKVSYWQGASYKDGYDEGFASADDWLGQHEDAMAEHGWVRLPKDADGVPIRVGDVMEGEKIGGGFGEPFEVVGYIMSNGELEPMDKHKCPRKRKYSHHYHEPTVEDVLREFGDWYAHTKGGCDEDGIIAEYAAKLRLAGEK